ncbi:MAG: hypothetical protein M9963_11705 [Kiritimatiellae bacterium]|nr:hypothetical protein [Kiritimatiellia bacterium]
MIAIEVWILEYWSQIARPLAGLLLIASIRVLARCAAGKQRATLSC